MQALHLQFERRFVVFRFLLLACLCLCAIRVVVVGSFFLARSLAFGTAHTAGLSLETGQTIYVSACVCVCVFE